MEYHRISFIHNDTEYSFIKAMNDRLVGYALMSACRLEVQIYMKENNLRGKYILTGMAKSDYSLISSKSTYSPSSLEKSFLCFLWISFQGKLFLRWIAKKHLVVDHPRKNNLYRIDNFLRHSGKYLKNYDVSPVRKLFGERCR